MTSIDTVAATTMRVVCGKDELAEKLQVVGRGVSTRTTVQILAGIMLARRRRTLHLSATDMEISVRVSLDAQVEEEGAVVVPGRLLVDIVRLLAGWRGDARAPSRRGRRAADVCGSASYSLNTYAAEDFPRLPEIEPDSAFAVEREAFLDTIGRVGRSASRDESRPVLTGILVRFEGDKLVMAATDSYRLSVKETALAQRPGPRARGDRPGPRAGRARACRAGGRDRDDRGRRPGEPGRLRRRRDLADGAPDRRPVPELQAAPPRAVRGRGARCRARSSSTSSGAPRCWRSGSRRFAFASRRAS